MCSRKPHICQYEKGRKSLKSFSNKEYSNVISELLYDSQYSSISKRGKMSILRGLSEVIVRKILNIGNGSKLMLGQVRVDSKNKAVRTGLEQLDNGLGKELISTTKTLNKLASEGVHTQRTEEFLDSEIETVKDAILNLYAILFIRYFIEKNISIFSDPKIVFLFSLLPPVIRYKTWNYMFNNGNKTILVADKLCLSIIKYQNKKTAYEWLEQNRSVIMSIPYPNEKEIYEYNRSHSFMDEDGHWKVSVSLDYKKYKNMYDLLFAKIENKSTSVNESGKMYNTFESAKKHYELVIRELDGDLDEEFLDLMEFVYIGRKSSK